MWFRRAALATGVLPLALLVLGDRPAQAPPAGAPPAAPATVWVAGPRPAIAGRAAWRADEDLVREPAGYADTVRAVVVHHTGHPNAYDCAEVPELLRAMQYDHVHGMGWDDLGYNFVIDRCGTVWEGRAGGVDRPVRGAHSKGFNARSVGIGLLGTYEAGTPLPRPAREALVALAAWKLHGDVDPTGTVRLRSSNDESRYPRGTVATLPVVSGHRDTFPTRCPGDALHDLLPALRTEIAALRPRR